MRTRLLLTLLAIFALVFPLVLPAYADLQYLSITGNPITVSSAPYLVLSGLTGQSACSITINTAGGAFAVEGLYKGTTTWTSALTTVSPDGTTSQTSESAAGTYVFNCATMVAIRADGTGASGTPSVTLNASGGISRILGAGVNGGKTNLTGTGPIVVTNSGNTANVSCPTCATPGPGATPVSVQAGSGIAVATPSPGVFVISSTVTPAPGATPVSVQAGANVAVATPSPGVFVVSAVTAAPPSITAGTGNVTVATPAANTYVVSVATPSPAPTVSVQGGTGITVATPAPNVFQINATPFSVNPAGCVEQNGSGALFGTGFACGGYLATAFTIPAVGSTVTMNVTTTGTNGIMAYVPITVSDGTHSISGYTTTNASTSFITILVTSINQGAAGNTMSYFAQIAYGGVPATFVAGSGVSITPSQTNTYTIAATGGGGSLTGITAGSNIVVSTPNPAAPTVAVTAAPGFTNVSVSTLTSGNCVQASTGGLLVSAAAACGSGGVTSVTGSGNISVTTGPTPNVTITSAPTFTAVTDSGLTSGNCVQATTGGLLSTTAAPCASSTAGPSYTTLTLPLVTALKYSTNQYGCVVAIGPSQAAGSYGSTCGPSVSASFVGPAIGSAVTVTTGSTFPVSYSLGTPLTITDGTNVVTGYVTSTTAGAVTSFSFTATGYQVGGPGTTFAAGAVIAPGGFQNGFRYLVNIAFGYVSGTVSTANDYPSQFTAAYTNGTLTKLHASCKTADNGTTVFTFTDSTAATSIGTIAMANAATTGTTTLGTAYTLVPGHQLTASVTTAGTATGCGLTAEGQAAAY